MALTNGGDLIIKTGNVGIGTTTPGTKLEVDGGNIRARNGTPILFLTDTNSASSDVGISGYISLVDQAGAEYGWIGDGSNSDNYVSLWGGTNHGLQFGAGGSGRMYITTAGNVGIGTTSPDPAYKLSVKGSIRAYEVIVETGWADFVFEENYKLMSLSEVEKFIKKNKHLPDIPSEKEAKAKGIGLGEMQTKLLQKIEELTLYVIDLKKENQEIKKDNQKIKEENESLKKRVSLLENK
jgi:hypothetical protein